MFVLQWHLINSINSMVTVGVRIQCARVKVGSCDSMAGIFFLESKHEINRREMVLLLLVLCCCSS